VECHARGLGGHCLRLLYAAVGCCMAACGPPSHATKALRSAVLGAQWKAMPVFACCTCLLHRGCPLSRSSLLRHLAVPDWGQWRASSFVCAKTPAAQWLPASHRLLLRHLKAPDGASGGPVPRMRQDARSAVAACEPPYLYVCHACASLARPHSWPVCLLACSRRLMSAAHSWPV
jgi:hypothetical protein